MSKISDNKNEWSSIEREALSVLQAYVDAVKAGSFERLPALYHKKFWLWNFEEEKPKPRRTFLEEEEIALKMARFPNYDIQPLAIEVMNNTAVVNVIYSYSMESKNGTKLNKKGNWTAVLIKMNEQWLFISCLYIDKAS